MTREEAELGAKEFLKKVKGRGWKTKVERYVASNIWSWYATNGPVEVWVMPGPRKDPPLWVARIFFGDTSCLRYARDPNTAIRTLVMALRAQVKKLSKNIGIVEKNLKGERP